MSKAKPWREVRRETLLDCRIFEVERSLAVSPVDDSEHDFFRIRNNDWVQIIPLTPDDEIVMVRQYRHGSSSVTLEVPGGLVDAGEAPAAAARRELLEETGFAAESVHAMGAINPNPAYHTHRLHSFYARDVRPVAAVQNTPTEQTEVVLVPLAEIADLLRADRIDHSLVAATLWRFLHEHVSNGEGKA
jgi:8-oxo-dGTP pyrophosphatase MutT (NUDIX family)